MATTTTNFGWDIPQSTDLVKDGATAIAALGQDIDTSMVDLKGGTTGQILSKASGTDMDFTWINNDQGDITGVTAGTGLTGGGTSGSVTLDFDVANYGGGQYAAGKNKLINGDFFYNQRAFTSTTTSNTYGFDRWALAASDGTVTYTPQTFTLGAAPVTGYEAVNYAQVDVTGQTLTSALATLFQKIEDVRTFAGQTVTLSFWAKASSGTPKIAVNLVQNFGTGGSPSTSVQNSSATQTISTSWARYSFTIALPSITGKTLGTTANTSFLGAQIWFSSGTASTNPGSIGIQTGTFQIWGVQLEAGSTASPFQTATGTKQGELAACQRYLPAINYKWDQLGLAGSTSTTYIYYQFVVQPRVAPTGLTYSALSDFRIYNKTGTVGTPTAITFNAAGLQTASITFNTTAGSPTLVQGDVAEAYNNAGAGLILFTGCEL